ncbi:CCA tRNA nucleotidyltransferase [Sulfurimonas marina]|uniref:CCA tRNA nucleotidyltransferase n=1 Tax=Sulfurimonas marina TaxID=2590551 RepID=A0A7M3V8Y2_9BACT|nr:CCA tRNA nucleotidyltransferase [Sulfurimonas marina]QOP40215.1 CCA tRNA nucleotidyltransferase [Sulfurimonas marina]
MKKVQYPVILEQIFEKLNSYGIKPVIIGGYIRDSLLQIDSKDIDIELYDVDNIDHLEVLLSPFGNINEVGKSFSVIKLNIDELDLDFSLPRIDSKIAKGHKGFKITADSHLDFKTATSRRDFTINAIGYDVITNKLLDPFGGIEDLQNKELRAVDLDKFGEDPLRVLRAVQFASRFELSMDQKLLQLCQEMIQNDQLLYLSKERIVAEIEKLLLKSKKPSSGFLLMKEMGLFQIFQEFHNLSEEDFNYTLSLLDRYKTVTHQVKKKEAFITMLTLLTSKFSAEDRNSFLERLTNDKEILHKIFNLHTFLQSPSYTLAMRLDLELLHDYLQTIEMKNYQDLINNIEPKIKGKDLIAQGLQPSVEFSKILEEKYQQQISRFLF